MYLSRAKNQGGRHSVGHAKRNRPKRSGVPFHFSFCVSFSFPVCPIEKRPSNGFPDLLSLSLSLSLTLPASYSLLTLSRPFVRSVIPRSSLVIFIARKSGARYLEAYDCIPGVLDHPIINSLSYYCCTLVIIIIICNVGLPARISRTFAPAACISRPRRRRRNRQTREE